MADDRFRIVLKIGGREYPLTIKREDEYIYRRAAKRVNEMIVAYRSKFSARHEDYLAMVALQSSIINIDHEDSVDTQPVVDELEKLDNELEQFLSKKTTF